MRQILLLISVTLTFFTTSKVFSQELKPNPNLEQVVVVFKTHFDIGYTDFAESVVRKYGSSMIEGALDNLDASMDLPPEERFVWTLPGWPMQQVLDRCSPQNKPRVEEAIINGNFAVHALPITFETEASDLESLARSFKFSSDISKKYGLELPKDAKMTDVPSHSWALPTILHHAGIKFLHLGCNPASPSPEIPLLFWWEGPDGSRLMTMYWEKYYGTDLVSPEGWPFKSWMALIPTNDNKGAPPAEQVKETLRKIRELAPNAKIKIGRMSDFYDLLIKENPELPVVKGDMPDTWIHGYMSMPKEVKTSRQIRKDIFALEALNTQLNSWTSNNDNMEWLIDKATENSLLFDEHTFGLAMSHGHSGYWAYGDEFKALRSQGIYEPIEKSWKEKGERIYEAEKRILPNYNEELKRLASEININENHITVYNPNAWERSGLVKLQVRSDYIKGNALKDLSTGKIIPFTNKVNVIQFIADDVPSMGYKTFIPVLDEIEDVNSLVADEGKNIIENEFFKIELDPLAGSIKSIIDKKNGNEIIKQESEYGFGSYLYERFSKENTDKYAKDYIKAGWHWAYAELGRPNLSDEKYKSIQSKQARVSYLQDELKSSAIMHFDKGEHNPHDISLIVSLYKDQPYVELNWAIHGKPAEPWPEAGWISFPVNVDNPNFKLGRLGGIVDPAKDFIKGSNLDYYFLNTGVALVDDKGNGVAISSPDVPGISLDRPGLWKYSKDFVPEKANVFFNLYNNQWSTNFTGWIEGSWNTRFYIWTVQNYENEKDLITPSEHFRAPLKAAFSYGSQGNLPAFAKGLTLSEKGILVTAFGPNPDGDGTLLRLWEQAGNTSECIISLPQGMDISSAQTINLRGVPSGEKLKIVNGQFKVKLEAYKPYSFVLK